MIVEERPRSERRRTGRATTSRCSPTRPRSASTTTGMSSSTTGYAPPPGCGASPSMTEAEPVEHAISLPHATECIWHIRAGRVVLATGAFERPLAFVGNDRPGVMLASSAMRYVERFGVLPGERAVAFVTNDWGKEAAERLRAKARSWELAGGGGTSEERPCRRSLCDTVSAFGSRLREPRRRSRSRTTAHRDRRPRSPARVSGGMEPDHRSGSGAASAAASRTTGRRATLRPGRGLDHPLVYPWRARLSGTAGLPDKRRRFWFVGSTAKTAQKSYVDLQRDSDRRRRLSLPSRGGLRSVEHVECATYIGTAVDQGRTSGVSHRRDRQRVRSAWDPGAQGPSNARPPYTPVSYVRAGWSVPGETLLDPHLCLCRSTRLYVELRRRVPERRAVEAALVFPLAAARSMDAAVSRECPAVRDAGRGDGRSTLGKIDVEGPDAPVPRPACIRRRFGP